MHSQEIEKKSRVTFILIFYFRFAEYTIACHTLKENENRVSKLVLISSLVIVFWTNFNHS